MTTTNVDIKLLDDLVAENERLKTLVTDHIRSELKTLERAHTAEAEVLRLLLSSSLFPCEFWRYDE
jgi:hypothetical protein